MECEKCAKELNRHDAPICNPCHERKIEMAKADGYERGYDVGCDDRDDAVPIRELTTLAAAIRRGDIAEAEMSLDVIARDMEGWRDAIDQGRFSRKAA